MGLLEQTVLGTPKRVHLQKLEQKQNRFGPTWKTLAFGLSALQFFRKPLEFLQLSVSFLLPGHLFARS